MIFKEIHIDGFGIFNGFSLTSLGKGVNILIGNNEVGKSTLLKFLKFTLFGYPRFKDQRMPPIHGGDHGGRIKALLLSGKEALFERTADDHIKLLFDGQLTENQSQWSQLLGNASADLYNNVFAFTLDELVNLDSLDNSGVEDKIFSVGLGLGKTSIGEIEKIFQDRADKIYTSRGKIQEIPNILTEIKNIKSKIQKIQDNLPKYQALTREIKQLEDVTSEFAGQLEKLRAEKNKLNNNLKCYDSFITVKNAEEGLNELPELMDYPEKGTEKLDNLEDKEQESNNKIQDIKNSTKDEKGIGELEDKINAISFNSTLLEKGDKVKYLSMNLALYKQALKDKNDDEQKLGELDDTIKQSIEKVNARWTEKDLTGISEMIAHKSKIEVFKKESDQIEDDKNALETELKVSRAKESPINVKNITSIISFIFMLGSIPAFYYTLYVLGGTLLLIALLLFFGKKYFLKEGSHFQIQEQLYDLKLKEQNIRADYENHLEQKLNLPKSLSIEATLEVFNIIDQVKGQIAERDKLKVKLETQRLPFIREFENEANSFEGILQRDNQRDNIEIFVNQIITKYDFSKARSEEKNELQTELIRKQKELNKTALKLEQTQSEIDILLKSIAAKDRQGFRKKYKENYKVKGLNEEKDQAIRTIETIVGFHKFDEVDRYLTTNEKEAIESIINDLATEIQAKEQEHTAKNRELGETKKEIEKIEGESELAEVLTELETEKQKLHSAYTDWISNRIALKIMAEVKARYEKEKQPAVIKNSSFYFNKITGDRYNRIRVSLDEKDVAVYDSKEASKRIDHLSRGTKEQLLISLRLGLIEEYEKQAEPLPVIVDEVLVNFDPNRTRQMAEIFQEFGENRQILIFTCHPATMDYFDNSAVNLVQLKEIGWFES